jgi:predicted N-formylglutamate amidohydrolase
VLHSAFERLGDPTKATGPFFLTCEHASNRLVDATATPEDQRLLDDHWGWDPGAAALTRHIVTYTDGVGVLGNFTRLLLDPNRPLESPTLIVDTCGDQPVRFNQGLTEAQRQQRIDTLYAPYHAAVRATAEARLDRGPAFFVSMHSFTPQFGEQPRAMEIGVLFNEHAEVGAMLCETLRAQGFVVAANAPYSGEDGFMYSIRHHGEALGMPQLMIEVRQDLLSTQAQINDVGARITTALYGLFG